MSDQDAMAALYALPDYAGGRERQSVSPQVTSDEDLRILGQIGQRFPRLKPIMDNSAVVQSPDEGDGRQLEYYDPTDTQSPTPGKTTFQMFQPFKGKEREDAVAADALHYLPGHDPKWRKMRDDLIGARSPEQQRIDNEAYGEEHDPGQTQADWMDRNRSDAYARAGIFPERNPEWQRPEGDPEGWTEKQRQVITQMLAHLGGK